MILLETNKRIENKEGCIYGCFGGRRKSVYYEKGKIHIRPGLGDTDGDWNEYYYTSNSIITSIYDVQFLKGFIYE